jgi:hypothetical protein
MCCIRARARASRISAAATAAAALPLLLAARDGMLWPRPCLPAASAAGCCRRRRRLPHCTPARAAPRRPLPPRNGHRLLFGAWALVALLQQPNGIQRCGAGDCRVGAALGSAIRSAPLFSQSESDRLRRDSQSLHHMHCMMGGILGALASSTRDSRQTTDSQQTRVVIDSGCCWCAAVCCVDCDAACDTCVLLLCAVCGCCGCDARHCGAAAAPARMQHSGSRQGAGGSEAA